MNLGVSSGFQRETTPTMPPPPRPLAARSRGGGDASRRGWMSMRGLGEGSGRVASSGGAGPSIVARAGRICDETWMDADARSDHCRKVAHFSPRPNLGPRPQPSAPRRRTAAGRPSSRTRETRAHARRRHRTPRTNRRRDERRARGAPRRERGRDLFNQLGAARFGIRHRHDAPGDDARVQTDLRGAGQGDHVRATRRASSRPSPQRASETCSDPRLPVSKR